MNFGGGPISTAFGSYFARLDAQGNHVASKAVSNLYSPRALLIDGSGAALTASIFGTIVDFGNGGVATEWHMVDNLQWLILRAPGYFLTHVGYTTIYVYPSLLLLAGAGLVAHGWRRKPALLRTFVLASLPAFFVVNVLFGVIYEWRVFFEVSPLLFLMAYLSLTEGLRSGPPASG